MVWIPTWVAKEALEAHQRKAYRLAPAKVAELEQRLGEQEAALAAVQEEERVQVGDGDNSISSPSA